MIEEAIDDLRALRVSFGDDCPIPLVASHNIADDADGDICYAEKTVIGMFVCDRYLIAQTLLTVRRLLVFL